MARDKYKGKPEKVTKPVLFRSLEGKGIHVLKSEETTDKDGKKVIRLSKTKPGNSHN